MKQGEIQNIARDYIDSALEAQRRLGYPAAISAEEYDATVSRAAKAFEELLGAGNGGRRARSRVSNPSN
jgi:hypothetical protein